MVKTQMAVRGQAGSSLNSPKFQKTFKKAFSVAEALIALLIGSLILGASAPMISKQLKHNNFSDVQMQIVNRRIEQLISENNATIEMLRQEIETLRRAEGGVPKGTVAFFNNEVEPESATNPCPNGWRLIGAEWNGRFPRFAGAYTVLDYDETNKNYKTTGTAQTLNVGATEEDAIRNISGRIVQTPHHDAAGGALRGVDSFNGGWGYVGGYQPWSYLSFEADRSVPTAKENRPRSVALLGCVKN